MFPETSWWASGKCAVSCHVLILEVIPSASVRASLESYFRKATFFLWVKYVRGTRTAKLRFVLCSMWCLLHDRFALPHTWKQTFKFFVILGNFIVKMDIVGIVQIVILKYTGSIPNQFMLRKLDEDIHLWSFSKAWCIVTHAETASFISNDVIRNWSFDSEMGSDRRLTLWNPETEPKVLWKKTNMHFTKQ